jgi:arylsulfatase A-like enzyme
MKIVAKIALHLVALLLAGAGCMARAQSKPALAQILREQGFSGALTGDIHFTPLGTLHCAKSSFQVVRFEWYGPANPGSHRAQYRIIFLEGGNHYVGSLIVEGDRPVSVKHNSVQFGYDQTSGDTMTCADIGPEKKVLLDGGWESIFK